MASRKQTQISRPQARTEKLVVENLGDEMVIYDLDTNVAHALKPLAAAVYTYADGERTPAEIAELASYRLSASITEAEVAEAIDQLDSLSLFVSPIIDVHTGLSRRQALKTFAAAGGGAMLVMSVATTAAQACVTCSTVPSSGLKCTTNSLGDAGPGDCKLCNDASQCGSDSACCCAPCESGAPNCCQPICITKSSTNKNNGYCPTGTMPLTVNAGSIMCPTGYGQAKYSSNSWGAMCCETGSQNCGGCDGDQRCKDQCSW
jgi:hypothetical protein